MDANSDASESTAVTDSPLRGSSDCVGSVQEVMEQEWERMRTEDATLPQITPKRKRRAPRIRPESCKRQPPNYPAFSSDEEYEVEIVYLCIVAQVYRGGLIAWCNHFRGLSGWLAVIERWSEYIGQLYDMYTCFVFH